MLADDSLAFPLDTFDELQSFGLREAGVAPNFSR
jgi:hypothetical protein